VPILWPPYSAMFRTRPDVPIELGRRRRRKSRTAGLDIALRALDRKCEMVSVHCWESAIWQNYHCLREYLVLSTALQADEATRRGLQNVHRSTDTPSAAYLRMSLHISQTDYVSIGPSFVPDLPIITLSYRRVSMLLRTTRSPESQ